MEMKEKDVRAVLRAELSRAIGDDGESQLLEEMGVRHGLARVDLVVVNGDLHGFEIKCRSNSLRRLPNQVEIFSSVLDRVTLVASQRLAARAVHLVPEWWGVKVAERDQHGVIRFVEAREAAANPSTNALSMAKLLWREEALEMLDSMGAATGLRSKPRRMIYARLAEVMDVQELRAAVCQRLKQRPQRGFDAQRMSYDG